MSFSGSYLPEDVTFLLKTVDMPPTEIEAKERLIQAGRRHYSEMLSAERAPDPAYMDLFWAVFRRNRNRFAADMAALAKGIAARKDGTIAVTSLARAGTPVGVLLRRALRALGREVFHYSVSIIRDRGIDEVALDRIVAAHGDGSIMFVDGWTGKGAITAELKRCVTSYNTSRGVAVDPSLAVVADLAGVAALSSSYEDYLIPSSVLNAIVSGLVSRTVLNAEYVGPGDFHACVYYTGLEPHDISRRFVDEVTRPMLDALFDPACLPVGNSSDRLADLRAGCEAFVASCMERHGVADRNRIKPGIGESTRSLLRRVPETLIVREPDHRDVAHLMQLARGRGVRVIVDPTLARPYRAAAIIKTLGEG
ncbi:cysteine protease StiP family protein [Niveispirillum sp. BGYR6]|uniref:cysteine protease StiP family protein n=1 Tax=Niveispirillum sp. BGYR6 TaxID=2971249 RepID=UPI0022B95029|nr:cysteine protease StiP family protein [Niveispirillum sp. BGYR6]MDG5496033.1 cysteine protease StiP family protein [Niveispirillum sp. BGYR6]